MRIVCLMIQQGGMFNQKLKKRDASKNRSFYVMIDKFQNRNTTRRKTTIKTNFRSKTIRNRKCNSVKKKTRGTTKKSTLSTTNNRKK